MRRQYAGRVSALNKSSDGEQGFWPSYADMMSAVALILFFLMLLSYIQNLITGNNLQSTQEKLANTEMKLVSTEENLASAELELEDMEKTLALTLQQVEKAESDLAKITIDLDEAKLTLTQQQEDLNEQNKQLASQNKLLADQKKAQFDYRFPLIQNSGLLDALGTNGWPIQSKDNLWLETFDYWKRYNNIPVEEFVYDPSYETGLKADESCYAGEDERFIYHKWFTEDESHLSLYQVMVAKRMPHAVDLRQIRYGWEFIRHFRRNADGSLEYDEAL